MAFHPRDVRTALTPAFDVPEAKLVWALRAALLLLAAFGVLVDPLGASRALLAGAAAAVVVVGVLFAFVPTDRPRTLSAAQAALLFAVLFHVGGHAFGLYQRVVVYDKVLHLVVPLATALVLYALSQATDWIWDWRTVSPMEVGVYLFSMTLAFAALWEIHEYASDALLGTTEQRGLDDTMIDLILGAVGALVGAAVAAWATRVMRRAGPDAVSEDPKATPNRLPPEGDEGARRRHA